MKGRCQVPFGDSGRALSHEDRMGGSVWPKLLNL